MLNNVIIAALITNDKTREEKFSYLRQNDASSKIVFHNLLRKFKYILLFLKKKGHTYFSCYYSNMPKCKNTRMWVLCRHLLRVHIFIYEAKPRTKTIMQANHVGVRYALYDDLCVYSISRVLVCHTHTNVMVWRSR